MSDSLTAKRSGLATIEEACSFLALGRTSVYLLMDNGEIPSVKIGRCRRIRWSDLHSYITNLAGT